MKYNSVMELDMSGLSEPSGLIGIIMTTPNSLNSVEI